MRTGAAALSLPLARRSVRIARSRGFACARLLLCAPSGFVLAGAFSRAPAFRAIVLSAARRVARLGCRGDRRSADLFAQRRAVRRRSFGPVPACAQPLRIALVPPSGARPRFPASTHLALARALGLGSPPCHRRTSLPPASDLVPFVGSSSLTNAVVRVELPCAAAIEEKRRGRRHWGPSPIARRGGRARWRKQKGEWEGGREAGGSSEAGGDGGSETGEDNSRAALGGPLVRPKRVRQSKTEKQGKEEERAGSPRCRGTAAGLGVHLSAGTEGGQVGSGDRGAGVALSSGSSARAREAAARQVPRRRGRGGREWRRREVRLNCWCRWC